MEMTYDRTVGVMPSPSGDRTPVEDTAILGTALLAGCNAEWGLAAAVTVHRGGDASDRPQPGGNLHFTIEPNQN